MKGTEASSSSSSSSSSSPPPPPPVAKPLTDLSPINVDATAIEKEKKRNDDDSDKDEPLRMIGKRAGQVVFGRTDVFQAALEDGESVGSRRRVRGDGIENDETFHGGLRGWVDARGADWVRARCND